MQVRDNFVAAFLSAKFISEGNSSFVIDWKCAPQSGREGLIEFGVSHLRQVTGWKDNLHVSWEIESDCDNIRLVSEEIDMDWEDVFTIAGERFLDSDGIDTIIERSSIVATFASDYRYSFGYVKVLWSCFDGFERQNGFYLAKLCEPN